MIFKKLRNKFKRLFCEHNYIRYLDDEHAYLSVGDEYHKRKSYKYRLICSKCGHKIEMIDKWRNKDIKRWIDEKND